MKEVTLEQLAAQRQRIAELSTALERAAFEKNEQSQEIGLLKEQIKWLQKQLMGRKSERFENPAQTSLLDYPEFQLGEEGREDEPPKELERVEYTRERPKKRGTKPIPDHLERVVVPVDPEPGDLVCACCSGDMVRTGETVTEELDYVPAKFRVKQFVQGKFRCPSCMNRDIAKPLPPRIIQKGRASPGLLAHLVVAKYVDHVPLNRQEQIFKRHGVHLARSTMDEWFGRLSEELLPIVGAIRRRVVEKPCLQMDETPFDSMETELRGKGKKKGGGRKMNRGYAWVVSTPDGEVVYHFTSSRASRHAVELLEGFEGYLQTDGYVGYNEVFRSGDRKRVACMAHIRRKFFEARESLPERVDPILAHIRGLYVVEKEARTEELDPEARHALREEKSRPIFVKLAAEIDELEGIPTPRSKLGKALTYAKGQWESMERYFEDGRLEIDNNACERAIRPAVMGRKNFLMLGSVKGGSQRASVFYTLTQSAKRIGIEPFAYLRDVLTLLPSHPQSRLDELTPLGWKLMRESVENIAAATVT